MNKLLFLALWILLVLYPNPRHLADSLHRLNNPPVMPRADLKRSWRTFYQGFWEVMPGDKKLLVFAGFPIIFGLSRPGRFT